MEEKKQIPQIKVFRDQSEKDWTLSEFHISGVRRGVGVEDEKRDVKVHGETRIPNGIYEVDLVNSPRFSKDYYMDEHGFLSPNKTARFNQEHLLLHVKDVPGFEHILWHWGNTDLDTHGCYLVGSSFHTFADKGGRKGVAGSRVKYVEIYPVLYALIVNNKKNGIKTFVEYTDKLAA